MSKSYDDLQQEAEAHWREVSTIRTRRQAELDAQFAAAPDVVNAPPIGTLYSHPAIACSCGCLAFTVIQYGCLNGIRDKAVFKCQRCGTTQCWNWTEMMWIN